MRKILYTLNVDGYAPAITELTFPVMRYWAHKIGAEFVEIKERRYPGWPAAYEKLQIHRLARELKTDWNLYLDADALVHPETPDWTNFIPRDTVTHNGIDQASVRWRYDEYFWRDGRNIGSCNWNTIASSWCIDLWKPLDDLTLEQALDNIRPTVNETRCGLIDPAHLLDDYVLSRNIARYGLKVQTLVTMEKTLGFGPDTGFYWHAYTDPIRDYPGFLCRVKESEPPKMIKVAVDRFNPIIHEKLKDVTLKGKVTQMREVLARWGIA